MTQWVKHSDDNLREKETVPKENKDEHLVYTIRAREGQL